MYIPQRASLPPQGRQERNYTYPPQYTVRTPPTNRPVADDLEEDDWHFGRPRTSQTDQKVGHGDSTIPSHFFALNLNHRAQIIECPASDCTKAIIYLGAQIIGDGQDLAVVTLTFKDVNGDGKL